MDEKSLLLGYLSKVTVKTDEELADLLYQKSDDGSTVISDNALDVLLDLDKKRVERLKKATDTTEIFNNGHKKGLKEAMEKFEKEFKEKTGFESEGTGLDLILGWGETIKTSKSTDDQIKTHPAFLNMEKRIKQEMAEAVRIKDEELTRLKGEFDGERKFSTIKNKAEEVFLNLNPILSDDKGKAKRQTERFLNDMRMFQYEQNGGDIIIMSDGKRMEDEHGNVIPFNDFIKSQASQFFDFKTQDGKGNAGNESGGGSSFTVPKNDAEYVQQLENEKDPKRKVEIQTAYWRSKGVDIKI